MAQRVALVTGGAVRLGRAITLGLAEAGFDLVIHYRSSEGPARQVVRDVEAMGRGAVLAAGDLADPAVADSVAEAARAGYGRLDLVVNSAASFEKGRLLDVDAEAWDAVMDLNVRAPHLVVRATAPLLRDSRGSVVNLVDLSAYRPWTGFPAHAVSKAALAHLTRIQARALAPDVRVNAIAPGAVLPPEDETPEGLETLRRMTPLGRLGDPSDVVRAVLYLADAPYVTGQILAVDGGRLLGSF
ncbi:MAG TPA: SDR family oxidoreductase [Longimicrobiales bacterium]|nr:SDR family oxidoreductase [Longimicrobiales bacterium]